MAVRPGDRRRSRKAGGQGLRAGRPAQGQGEAPGGEGGPGRPQGQDQGQVQGRRQGGVPRQAGALTIFRGVAEPPFALETSRLRLRQWREGDREPFFRMASDPEVMRYFPSLLTRPESDALIGRLEALIARRGWGFWALETK